MPPSKILFLRAPSNLLDHLADALLLRSVAGWRAQRIIFIFICICVRVAHLDVSAFVFRRFVSTILFFLLDLVLTIAITCTALRASTARTAAPTSTSAFRPLFSQLLFLLFLSLVLSPSHLLLRISFFKPKTHVQRVQLHSIAATTCAAHPPSCFTTSRKASHLPPH